MTLTVEVLFIIIFQTGTVDVLAKFQTFASAPFTILVLSTVERPHEQDESLFTFASIIVRSVTYMYNKANGIYTLYIICYFWDVLSWDTPGLQTLYM